MVHPPNHLGLLLPAGCPAPPSCCWGGGCLPLLLPPEDWPWLNRTTLSESSGGSLNPKAILHLKPHSAPLRPLCCPHSLSPERCHSVTCVGDNLCPFQVCFCETKPETDPVFQNETMLMAKKIPARLIFKHSDHFIEHFFATLYKALYIYNLFYSL